MAVRTERRYSSTNRSIIHRRYGVALSCKPYRFFLSLSLFPFFPLPSPVFPADFIRALTPSRWSEDRRCNYHEVAFIVLRPFDALKVNSLFTGPSVLGIDHRSPMTSGRERCCSISAQVRHFLFFRRRGGILFRETLENCAWKAARRFNLFTVAVAKGGGVCGRLWTIFRRSIITLEVIYFFVVCVVLHHKRKGRKRFRFYRCKRYILGRICE